MSVSLSLKRRLTSPLNDQELQQLYTEAKRNDVTNFQKLAKTLKKAHGYSIVSSIVLCPPLENYRPSIFILAAQHGSAEFIDYLLKNSSREDLVNYAGFATLESSSQTTQASLKRHFLLRCVTALNAASSAGQDTIVHRLIDVGADIETADCCGYSPLSNAAASGYLTTVIILVSQGADVTHTTYLGYTPLHLAAANGHLDVVQFFTQDQLMSAFSFSSNAPSPLLLAAIFKRREVVSFLLSQEDIDYIQAGVASKILALSSYLEPLNMISVDLSERNFIPLTALALKALGDFPLYFQLLPPLQNGNPMLRCYATQALEQYQQLTTPYSFETVQHTVSVGCYMSACFEVCSVLWPCALNTHAILMHRKLKREQFDCSLSHEIARGTHYISRITRISEQSMKQEIKDYGVIRNVPPFPRYVKYGIQLLELIQLFQYHDMHILGYVQPIQAAILTLFRQWLCLIESHRDAPASDRWRLGQDFISLSAELISDITTPIHIALEKTRYARYHPYLRICEELNDLWDLLDSLLQWGGTVFLNQPDSGGRLPIHLAAEADGLRSNKAWETPILPENSVSHLLLSYGAHDDVYPFMGYWHARLDGVQRLTCLSCRAIIKSDIPYMLLRIPPRLKTLLKVHDHQTGRSTRSKQPKSIQDISIFIQLSNSPSYDQYFRLR